MSLAGIFTFKFDHFLCEPPSIVSEVNCVSIYAVFDYSLTLFAQNAIIPQSCTYRVRCVIFENPCRIFFAVFRLQSISCWKTRCAMFCLETSFNTARVFENKHRLSFTGIPFDVLKIRQSTIGEMCLWATQTWLRLSLGIIHFFLVSAYFYYFCFGEKLLLIFRIGYFRRVASENRFRVVSGYSLQNISFAV